MRAGPHGRANMRYADGGALRAMLDSKDGKFCERCKCCEMDWFRCEHCGGEGLDGHDCGEDCCACLEPEENVTCYICEGDGGWWRCGCNEHGIHEKQASA